MHSSKPLHHGAPEFDLPEAWSYQGPNPEELRKFAIQEMNKIDPKTSATGLVRASILIQILGTKKSIDLSTNQVLSEAQL